MYKHINVNTYGTEWDFISNVISQLESCGLQCMTNKEELQSAMEGAAESVIPIVFQYRNFQFVLQRNNTYNVFTDSYNFYAIHNDTELFTSTVLFSNMYVYCTAVAERNISLTILINENHMEVLVYDYNENLCAEVFFIELNGEVCYACSDRNDTPAFDGNIIATESKTLYKAVNSMPFQHNESEKMFYISGKMFSSDSVYAASDNELLDCTTVMPKMLVTINDKIYYALSSNTLIATETVSE
ncbi:MAG: hypothetical protein ACI4M3_06805 [Acutalibacteraceae bacterium]